MGLFDQIQGPVEEFLNKLFADKKLRESITYKTYASAAYDSDLGYKVVTYNEVPIYAVRLRHNHKSIRILSGDISAGDEVLLIRGDDAPSDMSTKDQIVDASGNIVNVKGIDNIFSLAVLVTISSSVKEIP